VTCCGRPAYWSANPALEEVRGADPLVLMGEAMALCRQNRITSEEKIVGALLEW
jgi:hypothetical protein